MKIGFINDQPETSGIGNYAFQLFRELKSFCNIEHIFLNYEKKVIERIDGDKRILISNITRIPYIDSKPLFWWRCGLKFPKYDLYHITNHNLSYLAKGRKAIITYHDFPYKKYFESMVAYYGRKFLYFWLKYAEYIICISNFSNKDMLKFYNIPADKTTVIYHGVNENFRLRDKIDSRKRLGLSLDKKIIFCVAGAGKRKNVSTLIKAFSILNKKFSNVLLVKIGVDRKDNKDLIKKLQIEDVIKFIEFVSRAEIPFYYNASDLFIFPSRWESFGFPVLESMASGVPVVSSFASSLPEIVGDAGILVDPCDEEAMAKEMERVLINKNLQERLIEKGLEQAKKFTWSETALRTIEVYKKFGLI